MQTEENVEEENVPTNRTKQVLKTKTVVLT